MNNAENKKLGLTTFGEIGQSLDPPVSHEQARRIYYQALTKVRRAVGPIQTWEIKALLQEVDQIEKSELVLYESPVEVG